ncbi:hypothetical protein BC829DRAFT_13931 [Chytridium lagenaria]|nr:hypothetical protein BC829DRAFT_13931 [Chytridium lagenaria]
MATSSDSAVPVKKPANAPPSAVLDALIKSVRDISLSAPASIPRPGTPPRPTASIPQPGTPPRPTASIRRPDTPRCTASILRPDTPRRNSVPTNMNQLAAATLENPPIAKVTQRDPRKPAKVGSASQVLAASSKRRHDDDEVDCAGPESEEGASRVIAKRNRPNSCRGSLTFTMDEAKVLANDFEQRMVEQGLKDKVEREKMAKHMDSMKELKELRESLEAERLEKERMMGMVAKNLKELLMRQKMKKDEEEALERERKNLLVARNNRRKLEREKRELDAWKARTRKERVADRIATLKKESSKADLNSVTLDRLPVAAKPEDIDVKELRELFAKMILTKLSKMRL